MANKPVEIRCKKKLIKKGKPVDCGRYMLTITESYILVKCSNCKQEHMITRRPMAGFTVEKVASDSSLLEQKEDKNA